MKFMPICAWTLFALAAGSLDARSETVEMKAGQRVTGEILKSDDTSVVIDLDVAVLRIPRAKIARIVAEADAETDATAPATQPAEQADGRRSLYREAGNGAASIEANVRRLGEAVVMVSTPGGLGSGFLVSDDGYCITNYHVIAEETRIKVTVFRTTAAGFEPKHYKKVRIIAINPFVDLALLKIDGEGDTFKAAPLGRMDKLAAGRRVFAIGNPLGLTRSVSQGIVSTTNRNFEGRLYIQTTTDINPGNSGGPLFNLNGQVVGVTSMGYIYLGGLNFAIPVDVVKSFIDNRDAFAYDEDNPNSGHRYLQPSPRLDRHAPPPARTPTLEPAAETSKPANADTTKEQA